MIVNVSFPYPEKLIKGAKIFFSEEKSIWRMLKLLFWGLVFSFALIGLGVVVMMLAI